jgi:hypothetical protein
VILAAEHFSREALSTIRRPVVESGTPIGGVSQFNFFFY